MRLYVAKAFVAVICLVSVYAITSENNTTSTKQGSVQEFLVQFVKLLNESQAFDLTSPTYRQLGLSDDYLNVISQHFASFQNQNSPSNLINNDTPTTAIPSSTGTPEPPSPSRPTGGRPTGQPGRPFRPGQSGRPFPPGPGNPDRGQPYPGQPGPPYPGQTGPQYPGQPGPQYPGQTGPPYPGQPGPPYPGQPGPQYPGQPGPPYPGQTGPQYPGQPGPPYPGQTGPQYPGQPGPQYPGQTGPPYPGQPGPPYPGQPGPQYPGQPGPPYPGQPGPQYPGQPGPPYPGQPGPPYPPGGPFPPPFGPQRPFSGGYRPPFGPYAPYPPNSFYGALSSISSYDDLRCVPRLLCEVTASRGPIDYNDEIHIPFVSKEVLITVLTVLNFVDDSPVLSFARAALLGYSSRGDIRACLTAYPTCPRDPDELIHYLNNHNGGFFRFFNQQLYQQPQYVPHYLKLQNDKKFSDSKYDNKIHNVNTINYQPVSSKQSKYGFSSRILNDPIRIEQIESKITNNGESKITNIRKAKRITFNREPVQHNDLYSSNDFPIPSRAGRKFVFPREEDSFSKLSSFFPDRTGTGNLILAADKDGKFKVLFSSELDNNRKSKAIRFLPDNRRQMRFPQDE